MTRGGSNARGIRRGAAAVELAICLPLLGFIAVATVDFGRIFYVSSILSNCARNGAVYASDPLYAATSPYTTVELAALADAGDLTPAPIVKSASGTDSAGNPYVDVTVSHSFSTIMNYPGIPATTNLSRTVRVRVAATLPN